VYGLRAALLHTTCGWKDEAHSRTIRITDLGICIASEPREPCSVEPISHLDMKLVGWRERTRMRVAKRNADVTIISPHVCDLRGRQVKIPSRSGCGWCSVAPRQSSSAVHVQYICECSVSFVSILDSVCCSQQKYDCTYKPRIAYLT
jgi:hypothetical protein